ncbi:MAG TPA: P1 family peptidase, partial [Gemmatimonadales bacterium]|nr:P1 family peptidase [Gemmatimonadales bacterium]
PGALNAITDVVGVEVGHSTIISGSGRLERGKGPVRTGVTAVFPRGNDVFESVFASWFALNGNGEMTGTTWIDESGYLDGPVVITNTHSVGIAHDAMIAWSLARTPWVLSLPVVAETYDGLLNDINGLHVKREHVFAALDSAAGGPVPEGSVGGGTGMLCNGFKGGIGTSSRVVPERAGGYTVGVLVQCNYGGQRGLRIAGIPVGREIETPGICAAGAPPTDPYARGMRPCGDGQSLEEDRPHAELGSIIVVVATDAPLLPHQLRRIAKRASLGIGRMGGIASHSSGDIFVAFSTANPPAAAGSEILSITMLPNERMDALFLATIEATEEAITNAMIAAETMTGADDVRAYGIPHQQVREILRRYNRLVEP